jgi:hypothetical protein
MRQDDHRNIFHVAYNAAELELSEILREFEQLRLEKERIEKS